jgi:hypothetical protein
MHELFASFQNTHDLYYIHSPCVTEKKILVTLTQALDSQAKVLKSLSESLTHGRDSVNVTREDRFSHYRPLEEHAVRNGEYRIYVPFPTSAFLSLLRSDYSAKLLGGTMLKTLLQCLSLRVKSFFGCKLADGTMLRTIDSTFLCHL